MPPTSSYSNCFLQGRKKRKHSICFNSIQTPYLDRRSDQCYVRANIAIKLIKFPQIPFDLWQSEEDDFRKQWFSPSAAPRWWWAFNNSGSKWLLRRLSLTRASVGWTVMMTGPEYRVNALTPAVNHRMTPQCCGAVMCNIVKEKIKKKQNRVMEGQRDRTGNKKIEKRITHR